MSEYWETFTFWEKVVVMCVGKSPLTLICKTNPEHIRVGYFLCQNIICLGINMLS
jgi:hypothetical protein